MASQSTPLVVVMSVERDTKNKIRFQEVDAEGGGKTAQPVTKDKAVLEKLYISKKALKKLGEPGSLRVTIEAIVEAKS